MRTHSCKGAALSNGCPGPGDEEVSSSTRAKGPEREREQNPVYGGDHTGIQEPGHDELQRPNEVSYKNLFMVLLTDF